MQDNPNTEDPNTENPVESKVLDTEDWQLAFEPYAGHPGNALTLGFNFVVLKRCITVEPLKLQEAVEALDQAMEVLFRHTQFHEVAYGLFHKLIEGQLTLEEEERLKSLGLKF
jgi:hypothetical protein